MHCSVNLECLLLYGSIFKKQRSKVKDTDIIVVLKKFNEDVEELFDFIFENFPNPDFHIYLVEEIESNTAFLKPWAFCSRWRDLRYSSLNFSS